MSWTKTTRTAAEELGPPDFQNSSTGCEPNDHFITEAYVEFTQESVIEQRFPEDLDCDDITFGQTNRLWPKPTLAKIKVLDV